MGAKPILVEEVSFWMAIVQGLMAFFSPCVLPLIPFFLSLLLERRCTSKICLFCVGFCTAFSLMGAASGFIGSRFETNIIGIVAGAIMVFFSVLYILDVRTFKTPVRLLDKLGGGSKASGFVLGAAVGLMWMPCSTPVLAGALTMASLSGTAIKGALLLLAYSLGILIPFLVLGKPISDVFYRVPDAFKKVLRVSIGLLMAIMGIGVMTGHPLFMG